MSAASSEEQLTSSSDAAMAPTFRQPLRDLCVRRGRPTQLKAIVTGLPTPSTTWWHEGQPLQTDA